VPESAPQSGDGGAPDTAVGARDAGGDGAAVDARAVFEPPRALTDTAVPYPAAAPPINAPVLVTVKLLVDTTGAVTKVDLLTPPAPPFDEAVMTAARGFRFDPGRYGGKPVSVAITFTQKFLPRARPPAAAADAPSARETPAGPALTAVLRGRLVELGTRRPLAAAAVIAQVGGGDGGQDYRTESDAGGHFRLPLPPGPARVSVFASEHHTFVQRETLAARQELAVTYLIERERYNLNETVVVAERRRDEVSRITLRGDEIQKIPGTFGDPFRVIQTLPGVSSVVSLLPFPIVRGASPASTGFLLDGTRIPLLFHLLAGPSVVHPVFIDEIQFFPGGAPAPYGGYVGGIVDGRTRRARPDERLLDFDVNLLQAGGFVRAPVAPLGATVTAAGRYGYPGFLLGLATNEVSLSYWDYQLRIDGGKPASSWTVFLFGARDQLDTPAPNALPNDPNPPLEPSLILGFHRLDLRLNLTQGRMAEMFRAVLGYDRTLSNGTDFWVWTAEPQLAATWTQSSKLRIAGGLLGTFRSLRQGLGAVATDNPFAAITSSLGTIYVGSGYLETIWRPTPDVLIRPGVRADVYADATATKPAVDPRLTLRYRLFERNLPGSEPAGDARAVWLKASAGIYHQPPRFVLPLPGLDLMPLKYGLLRSYQTSLGTELPLHDKTSLSVEGFFNYMDPTIFDLSFNQASVVTDPNRSILPTNIVMPDDRAQEIIDRLTAPQLGRAYGLEVLLRRQSKTGPFGWISYTLSRSERYRDGAWAPYDFDRPHLFNLVAGLPLRRNWDLGLRLQYQSGRPTTTTAGYNAAYGAGYFRFDFRVDKRAVWRNWLLDFYVDVTNAALLPEEVQPGAVLRYVLPTAGVRGRF
jgi:TonB family protein